MVGCITESLLFQKTHAYNKSPNPLHPSLRSKIDVPWMCSDLFNEENPCGLIIAKGHLQ